MMAGQVPMPRYVRAAAGRSFMKIFKLIVVILLSSLGLTAQAADTYQIDPVHSSVLFKVRHLNVADFYGRFNDVS